MKKEFTAGNTQKLRVGCVHISKLKTLILELFDVLSQNMVRSKVRLNGMFLRGEKSK
jgi:hypothetical protein